MKNSNNIKHSVKRKVKKKNQNNSSNSHEHNKPGIVSNHISTSEFDSIKNSIDD